MERKTALQTVERHSWGGSFYDSFTHAAMFRTYKPFNFGVKSAQLFSSVLGSHLINKKFTYYTVAKGNVYLLPGGVDDYEWYLVADADVDFTITELLVDPAGYAGKGNLEFKIAINKDWPHEPTLLKTESDRLPLLRVKGHPVQLSPNSFELTVELQTSDPNAYIPAAYLMKGRRLIDASTSVADELNYKFAGDQFGEMFKLQSWTGNFARKAEFTDKFVRTEISNRNGGKGRVAYSIGGNSYSDGMGIKVNGVGTGFVYKQKFNLTNSGKADVIEAGVFISKIEARLEDRLMMDREMNFEFGNLEKTVDTDSNRPMKVAPGWRQIVRDGHFKQHNGSLTLSELNEYIAEVFLTRRTFSDRRIVLASGEAGVEYLNRLIAQEASQWQFIDTLFTTKRSDPQGYHDNELEYGAQFTKIKLPMGYVIEIAYDPIKDDRKIFPEKAPGTNRTLESYAMDIFDFGATDQKAMDATRPENITCVMQDGVEGYWQVSNVYDFVKGVERSGGNVYSNNKELGLYRETSGGLGVWDVTRVGRVEYAPVRVFA